MEDVLLALIAFGALLAAAVYRRWLHSFHQRTGIHPIFIWLALMVIVIIVVSVMARAPK